MTAAVNGHGCGPPGRLGLAWLLDTVAMNTARPGPHWPEHLPVGAPRVARWSADYDETASLCPDPDGREVVFADWVYRPPA